MDNTPRKKLTYVSVFSGIEAASVAWEPLGFEPAAFAEVDPFPSAVLKERYPNVPNLGDITKIDWSDYHGKIDIVVGGSPCQSFSVAGKREGLAGESGLMFEYIRAVREIMPRYFVWENVPGALSSEKGEAFRQLLSEMDDLGYGLAWRIFDAQFTRIPMWNNEGNLAGWFGPVAQRRRRIFLVGCLGDPEGAAEILFESDSLRWDHPSSREKRKELARAAKQRASEGSAGCLTPWDNQTIRIYSEDGPFATLMNNGGNGKTGLNRQSVLAKEHEGSDCLTPWDNQSKRIFKPEGCCPTLNHGAGMNTAPSVITEETSNSACFCINRKAKDKAMQGRPFTDDGTSFTLSATAPHSVVYSIAGNIINRKDENGGNQLGVVDANDNGTFTLNTIDRHAVAFEPGIDRREGGHVYEDVSGTLRANAGDNQMAIAFQQNTRDEVRLINGDGSIAGALSASSGMKQTNYICEGALPFNTTCITSPQNGNKPQWGGPCHTLAAKDHPPTVVIDRAAFSQGQNAQYSPHIEETDVMDTLVASGPHAVMCMASGQANAEIEINVAPAQSARQYKDPQIVCMTQYGEDVAGTLMAKADSSPCSDRGQNVVLAKKTGNWKTFEEASSCLTATYGTKWNGNSAAENGSLFATNGYVVRRLTPLECERLQGFPDGWTKIPYRGKSADDCPDTPRYKALGNSFAVPVVRWIGDRIQRHAEKGATDDKSS